MKKLSDVLSEKLLAESKYSAKVYAKQTHFERFFSSIFNAFGVKPRYEFDEIPMGTTTRKQQIEKVLTDGGAIIIQIQKKQVASQEEKDKILKDPKQHVKTQISGKRPKITIIQPEVKEI